MAKNSLLRIFKSEKFRLPYIEFEDKKSFLYHYSLIMAEYQKELETLSEDEFDGYGKSECLNTLKFVIKGMETVMFKYLDGYPSLSYNEFNKLITKFELDTILLNQRTYELDSYSKLYRTKKEYNIIPELTQNGFNNFTNNLELFHAPFQSRKSIPSNRFSIPGFPCLYVSDSLFTSWSEAISENDPFHAVCFSNHRPLYLADLVPLNFILSEASINTQELYDQQILNGVLIDYAIIYPLILACHSKIKYTESYPGEIIKFKSEYIIPQLLMQWYRENNFMIDGIRYLSCTAVDKFPNKDFNKYNFVIPVIECNESGYCSSLLRNFSSSKIYSYINYSQNITVDEFIISIENELNNSEYTPL